MAEASMVIGTISFPVDFYKQYEKEIWRAYGEERISMDAYGFWLKDEVSALEDSITVEMEGTGRWSFDETLEYIWCFARNPEITAILFKEKPTICFHYKDYEPSAEMLIEQRAVVTFEEGRMEGKKVPVPCVENKTIQDVYPSAANCAKWGFVEAICIQDIEEEKIGKLYENLSDEDQQVLHVSSQEEFKNVFLAFVENAQKFEGYIDLDTLSMYQEDSELLLDDLDAYNRERIESEMEILEIEEIPEEVKNRSFAAYCKNNELQKAYCMTSASDGIHVTEIRCYKYVKGKMEQANFQIDAYLDAVHWLMIEE